MLKNDLKILIVGLGSIGRRHRRNLLNLGFKNVYVYDTNRFLPGYAGLPHIQKLDLATLRGFDVVFICNPTALHLKTALLAAQAGCDLFIEKPLSHRLEGTRRLLRICRTKKLVTMVGCDMRFHPSLRYVKNYLQKKALGRIYSISHEFGYYLPYWRPGTDYRKNYAARKALGGGIILDDVHEFDLLFWLNGFAKAEKTTLLSEKVSQLEIETEDICFANFRFANGVIGSVKCDYLQQKCARSCKVVGEKGSLEWSIDDNAVWLADKKGKRALFKPKNFSDNDPYCGEIKYFLECVARRRQTENGVERARTTLQNIISRKI